MSDAVERRVAGLAANVSELREQFAIFGNLAKLLAATEDRVAAAEQDRRTAEREKRDAERREAEAMEALSEVEAELAELRGRDVSDEYREMYRRGYHNGYGAAKRGAPHKSNPEPRLRAVADGAGAA